MKEKGSNAASAAVHKSGESMETGFTAFFISVKTGRRNGTEFIRASFARVTQNLLCSFFLPGNLDGDSAPHTLSPYIFFKYASWFLLKIVTA
ncbi:hypothetical protein [Eubacterium sp. 14-2]|uniref:hypothetical protein n=1 Tax=Eubacterium sp. 14-2 TaxID=1235790 RepID=UPI0003B553CD|nr:hypothetical protein [Eubacterium sp. 14-2]